MDIDSLNGQQSVSQVSGQHKQHQASVKQRAWYHRRRFKALVVLVVVIVILGGVCAWWMRGEPKVNKSEYQAVFLTNGQVYFGKLTDVNRNYLDLKDIYYLQVQTAQPGSASTGSTSTSTTTTNPNSSGQVQLVKLGNELHGPEDEMAISHQQVLFWENLKPSGKVTQAIDKYQSQ